MSENAPSTGAESRQSRSDIARSECPVHRNEVGLVFTGLEDDAQVVRCGRYDDQVRCGRELVEVVYVPTEQLQETIEEIDRLRRLICTCHAYELNFSADTPPPHRYDCPSLPPTCG